MKFPYGISDFYKIITQDYFYVDRTDRIRPIEEYGESLLFLALQEFVPKPALVTTKNALICHS